MAWLYNFFVTYLRPTLDVFILAFLIYQVYKTLLQNRVLQVVRGILAIVTLYALAFILKLDTLLWILNKLGNAFIIIIAIVFQSEIKSFFIKVGQSHIFTARRRIVGTEVETILTAAKLLSSARRGALIVFTRQSGLKDIIDTGTVLNADISSSLILTVFGKDTALHDGAMIISGKKIVAAGCLLPLSEQKGINASFGTRHRAALGTAESSDAVVLVVSEETGAISLAFSSKIYYDLQEDELKNMLNSLVVQGMVKFEEQEADK